LINKILIIGGSGLVGSKLSAVLREKGHQVRCMGQNRSIESSDYFLWNVKNKYYDASAFNDIDTIINLAGAGVAEKRWSTKRKAEIRNSRIESTKFLFSILSEINHNVSTVIAASAIGYYGNNQSDMMVEESVAGTDFLATVVCDWENQINRLKTLNIRVVVLRIGVVLSTKGGALEMMALPVKWGAGSALGSGSQPVSWIHILDLCNIFVFFLSKNSLAGVYNAVSPCVSTNKEMVRLIASVLRRPLWLPAIPGFILNLVLGQRAELVLSGCNVSSNKIEKCGFRFSYPDLKLALKNLLVE